MGTPVVDAESGGEENLIGGDILPNQAHPPGQLTPLLF